MAWSPELLAFTEHVGACFDCKYARPDYCAQAVELHRRLRRVVARLARVKPPRR